MHAYQVVYPDYSGKWASSVIGSTSMGKRTQDDVSRRTLDQIRFRVRKLLVGGVLAHLACGESVKASCVCVCVCVLGGGGGEGEGNVMKY
jgi:hypothetical protein